MPVEKSLIKTAPEKEANITEFGKLKLNDGYLAEGETTAQDVFLRVASTLGDDVDHAQRLYNYMSDLWFMPATPILSNVGTPIGLGISCFLNKPDDSVDGLSDHIVESIKLSTMGGGVGADWSGVRSRGEVSKAGVPTPGAMAWMTLTDKIPVAASQGNTRRGAYASYLDVGHPEIEAFLDVRNPTGGDQNLKCLNIHIGVNITDAFMNCLRDNLDWNLVDPNSGVVKKVVKARDLWQKILVNRMKTGEPYLHFVDTANRALPQPLKDLGLKIHASNLCVAPETPILTDKGFRPISFLGDFTEVNVWNGIDWSETTIRKTGVDKKLLRVTFSDGSSIDCTPEHKFYVQETYSGAPKKYEAKDLYSGAKIEKHDLPEDVILPQKELLFAYDQGFYSGDGNADYEYSWIYEPKKEVIPFIQKGKVEPFDVNGRARWLHGKMDPKTYVPFDREINSRLEWLAGLLDADGCVNESTNAQCIQLCSVQPQFLRDLKLMLQEIGVQSSVFTRRPEGLYQLPANDGTGGTKEFLCKEVWMISINTFGTKRLLDLGLPCNRLKFKDAQNPQRDATRFVTVISVENTGRVSDTWCVTEPKRGKVVFNGLLTGNCAEIELPTRPDRTAVCCLSSVNLEKYDEWKNDKLFIEDILRMLDNNLQHFIDHAPSTLWRAINSARSERSVGLGAFGFHGYLMANHIPFESAMAKGKNIEIFKNLEKKAYDASLTLGTERGYAPDMGNTGHRFAHRMAIAPNASNSTICGEATPSIEPANANVFKQTTKAGTMIVTNKHLIKLMKTKYWDSDALRGVVLTNGESRGGWVDNNKLQDVLLDIAINNGSVQHLEWMDQNDKDVFKTAEELDQMWIIEHAADRAPLICQGQSVNLFFPPDVDMGTLNRVHGAAWRKGLKSLYYVRSRALNRASGMTQNKKVDDSPEVVYNDTTKENCLSCEG